MTKFPIHGGCPCGNTRYTADGPADWIVQFHNRDRCWITREKPGIKTLNVEARETFRPVRAESR